MDAVVSVSVSVSAETESFIRFWYRFWPKRKIAISACFGFGRNEKKPFGRTLNCISIRLIHLFTFRYLLTSIPKIYQIFFWLKRSKNSSISFWQLQCWRRRCWWWFWWSKILEIIFFTAKNRVNRLLWLSFQ